MTKRNRLLAAVLRQSTVLVFYVDSLAYRSLEAVNEGIAGDFDANDASLTWSAGSHRLCRGSVKDEGKLGAELNSVHRVARQDFISGVLVVFANRIV